MPSTPTMLHWITDPLEDTCTLAFVSTASQFIKAANSWPPALLLRLRSHAIRGHERQRRFPSVERDVSRDAMAIPSASQTPCLKVENRKLDINLTFFIPPTVHQLRRHDVPSGHLLLQTQHNPPRASDLLPGQPRPPLLGPARPQRPQHNILHHLPLHPHIPMQSPRKDLE